MSHKKGQGSSRNGRDSNAQRRGVKIYGGQACQSGSILIRQLGTRVHPGDNVGMGRDFTLYSMIEGRVRFATQKKRGKSYKRIHVDPMPAQA